MWIRSAALCIALMSGAQAAQIEHYAASEQNGTYTVQLQARVDISANYAKQVLADPDRVVVLKDVIQSVEHLASDQPGIRRIREHSYTCVLLFCVEYRNTLTLQESDNEIRLDIEPEQSDFDFGHIVWTIEPLAKHQSLISFKSESQPSFWVPPLIGSTMMESQVKETTLSMLQRMECEYQGKTDCSLQQVDDSTINSGDLY